MKHLTSVVSFSCICGLLSFGLDLVAAPASSVASKCTFKVQKQSGKRQRVEGSYQTSLKISETYEAEIRWKGDEAADFTVEAIYMVTKDKRTYPHSMSTYSVKVAAGSETNIVIETPVFEKRSYSYGSSYGERFEGVIARLKKGDEVLKSFCSKNNSSWKKLAEQKVVKCTPATFGGGYYQDNIEARRTRLQAAEMSAKGGAVDKTLAPAIFVVNRPTTVSGFSAMANLSSDYYGDFYGMRDVYYALSLSLRKFGAAPSYGYSYDGDSKYVRAYVRRTTELGKKVMDIFKDGERHDVNVHLHFPPKEATSSSYESSTPCCFLDFIETNAVKAVAGVATPMLSPVIESRRRLRGDSQPGGVAGGGAAASTVSNAPSFTIDSFCGYKFGGDYRSLRMESGYSSSNPDIVRSRLERPFRNFKYATLYHGKAGLQSVQLYFYDESHAMKSDDIAAEVVAVKSIFEKKYGIAFNGGPIARKGDMLFRVMMTGDACIRIEVSNSKIARQGQNFGANGGADVL